MPPRITENHADHAVKAAQEILAEVRPWCPLDMGIGLHSGIIVVNYLGTDGHLEFSIIGDTVNAASRLETLTKDVDHSLLISPTTAALLNDQSLQPLGQKSVLGREEEISVFVVPRL